MTLKPKGQCRTCNKAIFYLDLPETGREWWHEDFNEDLRHPAGPRPQDLAELRKIQAKLTPALAGKV